jgi:hypothetical protein
MTLATILAAGGALALTARACTGGGDPGLRLTPLRTEWPASIWVREIPELEEEVVRPDGSYVVMGNQPRPMETPTGPAIDYPGVFFRWGGPPPARPVAEADLLAFYDMSDEEIRYRERKLRERSPSIAASYQRSGLAKGTTLTIVEGATRYDSVYQPRNEREWAVYLEKVREELNRPQVK